MATKSKPPVTGGTHPLPFEKLAPLEFERLCLWLVEWEGFERAEALGQSGSEKGQDVRAWRGDRRFVFQCKRVREFAAATGTKEIVKLRRELSPAQQPHELVFVVSAEVSADARAAIREEWGDEATCHFWAGVELDERVKRHPKIVREFFQLPSETYSPLRGLQGQGGVGKTALALVLAQEMAPGFPDAQIFLDLQGVSERPEGPQLAAAREGRL